MTHDEIIKQLESLLSHCKSMIEKDGGFPIWEKDCEALEAAIAALRPSGEPLTLEQLREMDGRPIYVTTKNYGDGWCILNWHGVNKSYTYFSRTGTSEGMTATPISAKTYGDLWLAYRRPPEGEEENG